jgi:PAS domain S-box-containing protein
MKDIMWIKICDNCFWNKSIQTLIVNSKNKKVSTKLTILLELLIKGDGKPVDFYNLYFEIWDDNCEFNPKLLRNLVSELRKLIPCIQIINYYGTGYALQKFKEHNSNLEEHLKDILNQAKNGITITNPLEIGNPIIYANQAFCDMFEYTYTEVVGKSHKLLENDEREQKEITFIKEAIKNQISLTTIVKNYRQNGEFFLNQMTISPIFDQFTKKIKHFLWIHQDIT